MIPKPVPRTIWPASHPAISPTSNVIKETFIRHVQFRILRQGGGQLTPAPVKLSQCKDRNSAKLLTSPQNEHL